MCNLEDETFFSGIEQIITIGHSGRNERHLVGTERDPVPKWKAFVRSVVVLFLALYHVY